MAIKYFIQRPQVTGLVQWTGDNFSEIETLTNSHARMVAGVLIVTFPYGAGDAPVAIGQWLMTGSQQPWDIDLSLDPSCQIVDNFGPHNYTITDA